MNTVNERQAAFDKTIAGKLRSLAASARADRDETPEVRQALGLVADQMEARAHELDPPIKEPELSFSVINARPSYSDRTSTLTKLGDHWVDLDGNDVGPFSSLFDVDVLRVGIGEPESADEWHRLDVANAENDAYNKGGEDFAEGMRQDISALRASTPLLVEQRAYDKALAAVTALLGES